MQKNISASLFFLLLTCCFSYTTFADPGDTIKVQTFTFGSPQEGWFVMPSDTLQFEKVYMRYTLKCNPGQNPACGEWDYLTYTYQYQQAVEPVSKTGVNYMINGSSPDSFSYLTAQPYQLNEYYQYYIMNTDTISYSGAVVGNGASASSFPLPASVPVSRTQYLWKASELSAAGITAGNITGIQLNILSSGSILNHLSVRLKNTLLDSLTGAGFEQVGLQEVFSSHAELSATGWTSIPFLTPFYWDGTSNMIMEITYDNETSGTDYSLASDVATWKNGINVSGNERSMHFDDGNYVSVPSSAFETLDSAITMSFWFKGDPFLEDRTQIEAYDIYDHRILNVHLPWSDGNVYWDAGTTLIGSYDRIYKAASVTDYENNWHHWTFTKNIATGSMKIYKDGVLWHSGTGFTRPMSGIKTFWIGAALWNVNVSGNGNLDEFAVWNTELDEATIQAYLYKDLDALHPFAGNLLAYYKFNEADYFLVQDESGNGVNASVIGAQPQLLPAESLFRNIQNANERLQVNFEQGVYDSYIDSAIVSDIEWLPSQSLVLFEDINNPGIPTDTLLVWLPYYQYLFDTAGNVYDSVFIAGDTTIHLITTPYITDPMPVLKRWELGRYITPYGIGLSLGDGWTWIFDVSDYVTLLHDSVFLTAGNWQEFLDLQFVFIEGTPPRDPIKIQNLWNGNYSYGVAGDPIENHLVPLKVLIDPAAFNTSLKARITGHGFGGNLNCAEFCAREHYFKVNGTTEYTKEVWRATCGINPLFPQGGTWIYNRANWCPGAEVETYDFELTPFVTAGDTATLDYDIEAYSWNGGGSVPYYAIETQLVSYSPPNFSLDAAVDEIIRPSSNQLYSRTNPICSYPLIRIKNNGTTPLTSLTISYGIEGATPSTYEWSGILNFLETAEIELGAIFQPTGGNSNKFTVSVSNPNGGTDEYEYNNSAVTYFKFPPQYPSTFVVEVKTNNASHETSYTVADMDGNIVLSRDNLDDNINYKDTITFANGCYIFRLEDSGGDGLSFFANSDGSGYARFRSVEPGPYLRTFEDDFGVEISHEFTIGYYLNNEEIPQTQTAEVRAYPNPSHGEFWIDILLPERQDIRVNVFDLSGKLIVHEELQQILSRAMTIDLSNQPAGIYFLQALMKDQVVTKKLTITR